MAASYNAATRHRNGGLRKRCGCPRKVWPKCPHSWYVNFKPPGGPHYQLSLDRELGRHIDSKSEAEGEAEKIRVAIRAGTFHSAIPLVSAGASLTVADIAARYREVYMKVRLRPRTAQQAGYHLDAFLRAKVPGPHATVVPLAGRSLHAITKVDIESIRTEHRKQGIMGANRLLERVRHFFNWAIAEGYTERTPFKRAGVTVLKLEKGVERPRHRRLEPGEEEALLANAGPHLYALIVAALETGCRS